MQISVNKAGKKNVVANFKKLVGRYKPYVITFEGVHALKPPQLLKFSTFQPNPYTPNYKIINLDKIIPEPILYIFQIYYLNLIPPFVLKIMVPELGKYIT